MWKFLIFLLISLSLIFDTVTTNPVENSTSSLIESSIKNEKLYTCEDDFDCDDNQDCVNNVCVNPAEVPKVVDLDSVDTIPLKETVSNISSAIEKSVSAATTEKCSIDSDCTDKDKVCVNQICVLDKLGKAFKEKIPTLIIGSRCEKDEECEKVANAVCLENICQCSDNYVTSITSSSCLPKAEKEGDECSIDKQCEKIENTECLGNKCVKSGSLLDMIGEKVANSSFGRTINNILSKDKAKNCAEDSDCSDSHVCLNSTCVLSPIPPKTGQSISKSVQSGGSSGSTTFKISKLLVVTLITKLLII